MADITEPTEGNHAIDPPRGRLTGRAALVTGGSRGIGLGIARAFAREGADVLLVARNEASLAAAADELTGYGGRVECRTADIGDREQCRGAVAAGIELFDGLDVVVNGAGIYRARPFLEYAPADFEEILRVNLHGTIDVMQAVLPHMLERGAGRIVNIASTAGKWASRNQSAYNVSKHAVVGLTRCTALEFAATGITINAICPGFVQTDLIDQFVGEHAAIGGQTPEDTRAGMQARVPQGRFLDVDECGELAVYLASAESRGMTGQSILLDGGMLCV